MAPSSSSNGATTSVQVALRIRPSTNQDLISIPARFQRTVINAVSPVSVAVDATSSAPSSVGSSTAAAAPTSAASAAKKQVFTFDQVHPPAASQHALFTSTAQPLISRFVEGFNCTILAYGQTSSGKTFTMTGIDLDADPTDSSSGMGIIPRAVYHIFSRCREIKEERGTAWNFNIKSSFIEIYNEDLIDLLTSDDAGAKSSVQIREDKQGHILWEGLREVNVKNANEVMSLLRQGTASRRTNETDMNAQSSRSHAIFSLTLTQKKYTGSTPPPRSSSPLPPGGGRSPSRLARPSSSVYGNVAGNRVSSPTLGRPGTPSFAVAMGRGSARPPSSIGMLNPEGARRQSLAPGGPHANGDGEAGEWVTVVSKFHFVDLAGSERLKRTAAAGDRIKEGISINSGLLALGNVISALGDPARAKSHTASYIPYRDSKLTRLLQDSLGGNAHTLMIACVSPAEWNANETVNTLKYANRARNIKNRAVVNEKEEGWDDVEWLQGMVTRLRKDLKSLKEGGPVMSAIGESEVSDTAAVKRAHAQMAELRHNFEDIREKYVERTEELTRLRRELAEKQRASGGAVGGTAKYEEIVGPVIEEYEKTISAMEAELSLNRAALRHTNDLVDEKEAELAHLSERHSTTEMYVAELRARVAKLTEREASTEAYIRDLEDKVKLFNEDHVSSSGSISDLKRELAKFKDSESHSAQYIAALEARLAKSDESILGLQQSVEQLEDECDSRRAEVKVLQSRLENLQRDGQSWKNDLDARERKIQKIEADLKEREEALKATAEARERLNLLVNDVSDARKNLEVASTASTKSEVSSINEPDNAIESQLIALQQTHTATLTDLSSVTAKYRDALREIADLAAQLQEAKVNASIPPTPLSESPERPTEVSSPRRRMGRGTSKDGIDVYQNGTGRRLLYRQAASTESLHGRSLSQSLSLSQELSSARSRKASISSHGTSSSLSSPSHRPNLSLNVSPHERSVQSLEHEIMRLQEVLKEREAEITALEQSLKEQAKNTRTPPTPGTPANGEDGEYGHLSPKTVNKFQELRHSLDGLESPSEADESLDRLNELMRAMAQKESSHREIVDKLNGELGQIRRQHDELTVLSRDQAVNMSCEIEGLRLKHEEGLVKLMEFSQRETEITEALHKAQADHAREVEVLRAEHEQAIRAKEAELDALMARTKEETDAAFQTLCNQLADTSATLEGAKREHEQAFGKLKAEHAEELKRRSEEVETLLAEARAAHDAQIKEQQQRHKSELADAIAKRQAEHEALLRQRASEHATVLEQTRREYDDAIAKLIVDHQESVKHKEEEASTILQRTEEEYYNALTKLRLDHASALEKQISESATAIERLKDEHARELRMAEIAREGSLTESQSVQESALKELQEAHAAAIANKENLYTADIAKLKEEHAQLLLSKDEQHRANVLRLKSDHAAALHDKESTFNDKLEKLQAEHSKVLAAKDAAHQTALDKLSEEHSMKLAKLQQESEEEIARLISELDKSKLDYSETTSALRAELAKTLEKTKEEHARLLETVEQGHSETISQLRAEHDAALARAQTEAEQAQSSLVKSHSEEVAHIKSEHQKVVAALESDLIATQEKHREDLEASRSQTEQLLAEEKTRLTASLSDLESRQEEEFVTLRKDRELLASEKAELASSVSALESQYAEELKALRGEFNTIASERAVLQATVADMETKHAAECALLQQEHDLLVEELESHKAAADEFAISREETRHKHDAALREKTDLVESLQEDLSEIHAERDALKSELDKVREELADTRSKTSTLVKEVSNRDSLVDELEKHRMELAEMQENLQKTKDEMDTLQSEKNKQEAILRELQAQLTRSPSPGSTRIGASRPNGIPAAKIPPITPLPSVPGSAVPPVLKSMHEAHPSTGSSVAMSATSSRSMSMDTPESPTTPATSIAPMPSSPTGTMDSKLITQVQDQARQLEEQDIMIKTLNKQLTHCESDLQAHMDMVATLETSLAEAEKNLRKARMQATEIARERDNLNTQMAALRSELHEAKAEVVNVRRSVVEEKQSLEHRLDEERRAKERARQQLDSRMDELQRRKSKFACL